jgi:transposase-like protein
MKVTPSPYAGYRYPAEIISQAVWLFFRFALSFRDIEELLGARSIILTYATIWQWCRRFRSPIRQGDSAPPTSSWGY